MAESSKTSEPTNDLDLEDGEIESDNEEPEVISVDDTGIASHSNVTNTSKNPFAQNPKNDVAALPNHLNKTKDGGKHVDAKEKGIDG